MTVTRVLVVDDIEMFCEMAKVVLDAAGFLTETCSDAKTAQARVVEFRPDVILMDIQMPGIDGIELTRRLKADPATRHITIVAFTAYAAKGDEQGLKAAGFDGFVAKPVEVTHLAALVNFWLDAPASARDSHFMWP
jgi:CheY-like chemotaxis protein